MSLTQANVNLLMIVIAAVVVSVIVAGWYIDRDDGRKHCLLEFQRQYYNNTSAGRARGRPCSM
jgi:hypothetical protein